MKNIPQIIRNIYYYKIVDRYKRIRQAFQPKQSKGSAFDRIYQDYTQSSPIILDVGAFNGKSIRRFRHIFPSCSVHSFEPSSGNFNKLSDSYGDAPNTYINHAAVGSAKSKLKLNYNKKPDTSSLLSIDTDHGWTQRRAKEMGVAADDFQVMAEEVDVLALDGYIAQKNIEQVDLLKIDTQGYELEVLKGAARSIKDNLFHFIEIEIILHGIYQGTDKNISDIEALLVPYGYKLIATSSHLNITEDNSLVFDAVYARADLFQTITSFK